MFNLFKKKKLPQPEVSIEDVQLPDLGWSLKEDKKEVKLWLHPEETMALSLHFFQLPPDIPSLTNMHETRAFYRNAIEQHNGGILQVDPIKIKGYPVLKTIIKIPQQPTGITYLGSFIFPFKNFSFVVKVQAPELGATGSREAILVSKYMGEGKIEISEDGNQMEGWKKDPYDHLLTEGLLMNLAELEEHDEQFPEHHLSKTRQLLRQLEEQIQLSERLAALAPFDG